MKDNGTGKGRIVLLGFRDHWLGTLAAASLTISVRERNVAFQVCTNLGLKLN